MNTKIGKLFYQERNADHYRIHNNIVRTRGYNNIVYGSGNKTEADIKKIQCKLIDILQDKSISNIVEFPNIDFCLKQHREEIFEIIIGILNEVFLAKGINILGLLVQKVEVNGIEEIELTKIINRAKVIMNESVYGNFTPEDIANILNISYSKFRTAFKRLTNTSPSKYMNVLKLNEAKLLLLTTSQSIKEISYILNFSTPDYFTLVFKKSVGMTPKEFRNQLENQPILLKKQP